MKRVKPLTRKASESARLEAEGHFPDEICRLVPVGPLTLRRFKADSRYVALVESHRARARERVEIELGLARPGAVRALRGLVEGGAEISDSHRLSAATAILAATGGVARHMQERAEQALVKRLALADADLARRVATALADAERAAVEGLSIDELDRAARGES